MERPRTACTPAPRETEACAAPAQERVVADMYFGRNIGGELGVSDAQWEAFVAAEITPRFPDGLTLLSGRGQFREADGTIVEETSFVLILFYPYEDRAESSAKIEQIRQLYLEQFDQESVLRVDDPRPVLVSF